MKTKLDNLALIGGNNDLPLFAYNSIKKKYKNFVYIDISNNNRNKLFGAKHVYKLKIFELEKCINILKKYNINQLCFLGDVTRPDFSKLKLDNVLSKYISKLIIASKLGDAKILDCIIDIFNNEGYQTNSFIDFFPDEYALDKTFSNITKDEIYDINKGVSLLSSLSKYDNAQSCVISNGYVLAIEAVEGTDKMLSRINSIKKKISRNIVEGTLVKMPKVNQSLKMDLPTVGLTTLEMMYRNKLNVLAVAKNSTIVVEKNKFYKALMKYKIKLHFVD